MSSSTSRAAPRPQPPPPQKQMTQSERRRAAIDKGRNLVICFDGTANEFTDTNTNIVKLFTFLEKESPEQLCYYQTGVGTYLGASFSNPITKWLGKMADLGVALYLDDHVMGGYRYLQSTYQSGDRIYLFGFSRGAYTARALAGMLYTVGLLPRNMPEQVPFAYEIFKKGKESAAYKRAFSRTVTIEFLGVFDTVSSVGAIYPRVLPFSSDNHITKTFRHAISLDEHRAKFRSNPWHLTVSPEIENENDMPSAGLIRTTVDHFKHHHAHHHKLTDDERIAMNQDRQELDHEEHLDTRPPTNVKEVWFSGCHCDVGGGNAKDADPHALANIPLKWMLKEIIAADTGLIFRRSALERAHIDTHELVQAAERTKIEDHKHKMKITEEQAKARAAADLAASKSVTSLTNGGPTLKLSTNDGAEIEHVRDDGHDQPNGSTLEEKAAAALDEKEKEEEALYKRWLASTGANDALCKVTDELKVAPGWWFLEMLPFIDSNQDSHGHWKNSFRVNWFRKRNIPRPPDHTNPNSRYNPSNLGVSITDAPALFHISVRQRMEAEECKTRKWHQFWKGKQPYRPRAWPPVGEPVWVE